MASRSQTRCHSFALTRQQRHTQEGVRQNLHDCDTSAVLGSPPLERLLLTRPWRRGCDARSARRRIFGLAQHDDILP